MACGIDGMGKVPAGTVSHVVIYPGSVLRELDITPQGILVSPMSEALAKMKKKSNQDAGMSDDVSNEILNDNVNWRSLTWEDGTFSGLLLVFGKGDLYIYCSQNADGVDIQEVVDKGENVGFFEDDAVDITISGLNSDDYTIFAVLAYHDQYFGPFPKKSK